jgi:hypothetical protein
MKIIWNYLKHLVYTKCAPYAYVLFTLQQRVFKGLTQGHGCHEYVTDNHV